MMQAGKLFQLKIHFGDFRPKNNRGFSIPLTQRGVHQKSLHSLHLLTGFELKVSVGNSSLVGMKCNALEQG